MNSKRILSAILIALIFTMSVIPSYAATTQDKIKDEESEKQQIESSLNETQSQIDSLESKKQESETYLAELNTQLEELKESLESLQQESEAKQAELEKVQEELTAAKKQEQKQYKDMKLRIQFMYEKSSSSYLEMLFSAETFTEFLNRADNISQISEYDRDMLADYQETKDKIVEKEAAVKEEQEAIEVLRQESAEKQDQVEEVVASTYVQINEYAVDIEDAESEQAVLISKIRQQENSINALLKQAKDEEAAATIATAEAAASTASQKQTSSGAGSSGAADSTQSKAAAVETSSGNQNTDTGTSENDASQDVETVDEPAEEASSSSSGGGTYLGRCKITAYCSCAKCCGSWAGGSTASGTTPTSGRTVAMGGVPFGTKLSINGNIYTVEDRGTAYGHIDVYMGSHSEALSFGLQYADVYIVN